MSTTAKHLLSIREVCEATGLSHVRIYQEINSGRLQSMKVGRRRLISSRALTDWIADSEARAKGAA